MPDRKRNDLPFDSGNKAEQELWNALEELPREEPMPQMRRDFYRQLEEASVETPAARLRHWLGFSGNGGWVTAAVCVIVGVTIGQLWNAPQTTSPDRLAALEQNIALLNRELILDRLQDASASQRLRGVVDAAYLAGNDAEITRALIARASEDRVDSVRAAAIDALGPSLQDSGVGEELMRLLESAESPLVQLSLVDVVLRNGSKAQLEHLRQLAETDGLHPDVVKHVNNSIGDISI
jgi:hypothetical protein